jgi:hypothetical protein
MGGGFKGRGRGFDAAKGQGKIGSKKQDSKFVKRVELYKYLSKWILRSYPDESGNILFSGDQKAHKHFTLERLQEMLDGDCCELIRRPCMGINLATANMEAGLEVLNVLREAGIDMSAAKKTGLDDFVPWLHDAGADLPSLVAYLNLNNYEAERDKSSSQSKTKAFLVLLGDKDDAGDRLKSYAKMAEVFGRLYVMAVSMMEVTALATRPKKWALGIPEAQKQSVRIRKWRKDPKDFDILARAMADSIEVATAKSKKGNFQDSNSDKTAKDSNASSASSGDRKKKKTKKHKKSPKKKRSDSSSSDDSSKKNKKNRDSDSSEYQAKKKTKDKKKKEADKAKKHYKAAGSKKRQRRTSSSSSTGQNLNSDTSEENTEKKKEQRDKKEKGRKAEMEKKDTKSKGDSERQKDEIKNKAKKAREEAQDKKDKDKTEEENRDVEDQKRKNADQEAALEEKKVHAGPEVKQDKAEVQEPDPSVTDSRTAADLKAFEEKDVAAHAAAKNSAILATSTTSEANRAAADIKAVDKKEIADTAAAKRAATAAASSKVGQNPRR